MMLNKKPTTPLGRRFVLRHVKRNERAEVDLVDVLALILRTYSDSAEDLRIYLCKGRRLDTTVTNLVQLIRYFNDKIAKNGVWSRVLAFERDGYLLVSFIETPDMGSGVKDET
jgi:hypothetical protein